MKATLFLVTAALATGVAYATDIYAPSRSIKDQQISLKGFGSGTIAETDETAFEGATSIRVSTRNYFQGGRIVLGKTTSLTQLYGDKNSLLMFAFRAANQAVVVGGGTGGGRTGGGDDDGKGGGAGETSPGGGAGRPGGRPGGGATAGSTTVATTLKTLRLVITTTDGKKSEAYMQLPATSGTGWRQLGIPLQSISGFDKTNKDVKEIALSGDTISTFYVGQIRVTNDATPISGSLNQTDLNLALNDEVEFIGTGFGGASPLKITWDFDSADGIQVDAEGSTVKRRFRKPGNYTVTMTVSDVYGLKPAYVRTAKVTVNP